VNLSSQVDYYYSASGGKTGSFVMILTFLTTVSTYFILGGTLSEITITQVLGCIGLTMLGALLGRVIGVLNAHWNLIKLARELQNRLNEVYHPGQMKVA
jgi:hypothetical protein